MRSVDLVINSELELVGTRGKRPSSYRRALALLADGQVQLEPLVDQEVPLGEWQRGLELLAAGKRSSSTWGPARRESSGRL